MYVIEDYNCYKADGGLDSTSHGKSYAALVDFVTECLSAVNAHEEDGVDSDQSAQDTEFPTWKFVGLSAIFVIIAIIVYFSTGRHSTIYCHVSYLSLSLNTDDGGR